MTTNKTPRREVAYLDDDYRVVRVQGETDVVILAFGGAGAPRGQVRINEFQNTLGARDTVLFFVDLNYSWWNRGDALGLVRRMIKREIAQGAKRFSTIGFSMGGSASLLACAEFEVIERGLAFSPQADARWPSLMDRRWARHRRKITSFQFKSYAQTPRRADLRIVFGAREDWWQKRLFRRAGMMWETVPEAGHNAPEVLKTRYRERYDELVNFVRFNDKT